MEKTILVDHLLVNKFAYAARIPALARLLPYRDVRRGDIIVFKKPGDDVNPGNVLVKRAVGGPNDTIKLKDKALNVNDKTADGPWVQHIDREIYRVGDPHIPEMASRGPFGPLPRPGQFLFRDG
jgi:signal peptidase I